MPKFGHFWFRMLAVLLACRSLTAEQVPVRHMEGLMHGFLALRTLDGKRLADGEMTQIAEGDRVTSRLIFRFKDGSVYDDMTIFSQRGFPAFERSSRAAWPVLQTTHGSLGRTVLRPSHGSI